MAKLIIFSAPSGSGKSTIINYLLTQNLNLAFSISATSRPPRGTAQDGVEYFFLTPDEFRRRIANDEFLEYKEIYQDRFYGRRKEQVEKQLVARQNVVFDVDVVGGCNIKKFYGERALSVFIQPPSVEELSLIHIDAADDMQCGDIGGRGNSEQKRDMGNTISRNKIRERSGSSRSIQILMQELDQKMTQRQRL